MLYFLLIWCDVIRSLEFDHLILFRLNVYAWFEEVEHVMFLKLDFWKKTCIFREVWIFKDDRLQELVRLLALERILSRRLE